jgi:hypothetical protein
MYYYVSYRVSTRARSFVVLAIVVVFRFTTMMIWRCAGPGSLLVRMMVIVLLRRSITEVEFSSRTGPQKLTNLLLCDGIIHNQPAIFRSFNEITFLFDHTQNGQGYASFVNPFDDGYVLFGMISYDLVQASISRPFLKRMTPPQEYVVGRRMMSLAAG